MSAKLEGKGLLEGWYSNLAALIQWALLLAS